MELHESLWITGQEAETFRMQKLGEVDQMYKIVKKQELTTNIYLMDVEAKRVAKSCQPGQFVIVRMGQDGERIPLTICDYDV